VVGAEPGGARRHLRRLTIVRRDADPEHDCFDFTPGAPGGECETDGHYRCVECRWMRPRAAKEDEDADDRDR